MAAFIEATGHQIAFGLTWGDIKVPKKERSEATEFARRLNASHIVRCEGTLAVKYGAVAMTSVPKKGKLVSGAALFALFTPEGENSILVLPLEEGRAALVVIVAGVPYVDVILGKERVQAKIESVLDETQVVFKFYGTYEPQPEAALVTPEGLVEKDAKKALLRKFHDPRKPIAAVAAVLIAAGVLGGYQWVKAEKKRKAEEARKAAYVDPNVRYSEEIEKLLGSTGMTGAVLIEDIWGRLKDRDIAVAGWVLTKVTCKPAQCTEEWASTGGTAGDLADAMAGIGQVATTNKGTAVKYSFKSTRKPLARGTLPNGKSFAPTLTASVKELKLAKLGVKEGAIQLAGLPSGVMSGELIPSTLISRAEFELSGPLGLFTDTPNYLPSNISFDEVTLDFAGGVEKMKFVMKGYYYVKA